ncbi:Ppx/GppA phosphatase family protein [Gramella sp. KN1008]|uniref:Ppx/GppA phosphatase family protein n=1 Tax=Gramella sp. KN1008 TaxID=2529298 RepID=UPI00103A5C6A|nr:Ppx/GppA phosphatase family protein [Gramella sp. KN1008]TBW29826.1 Ppx/GppA family phosphatase [Gramella sp. KN1008]
MSEIPDNSTPTKRIAAIDLGTNSFHAVLVDLYPDGSYRTIDKLKEMVILAEKGMKDHLSEDAMQRGLDALKRIKFLCDSKDVEEILAFATSAIREAKNGGDFIQRMIDEVGIKARAIPGKREAEMIGYAVRHSIAMDDEMVLMVDIGGGSVEFIVGNNEEFIYYNSFKLGVARMAARFVRNDPITQKEIKELWEHYRETLKEISEVVSEHSVKTIIGSSGTMENIAAMIAQRNSISSAMTLNELVYHDDEFLPFYENFIKLNRKERAKEKELDEKRIDIINPGMVLVKFLIEEFNIQNIKISEAALRDGIILNYINKERSSLPLMARFSDPRKRSVFELLRKCNWMKEHSTHVAQLALQIFDEFRKELKLKKEDRELLEYATYMHDIGYYISHRKHHKHALYLIMHADLRGFTADEISLMANVARYHRRSVPRKRHKFYRKLDSDLKQRVKRLSGILRVADGLDRSHYQNVQELEIEKGAEVIKFYITTQGDPELEIWGAMRKKELFEEITGKELEIYAVEQDANIPVETGK